MKRHLLTLLCIIAIGAIGALVLETSDGDLTQAEQAELAELEADLAAEEAQSLPVKSDVALKALEGELDAFEKQHRKEAEEKGYEWVELEENHFGKVAESLYSDVELNAELDALAAGD